jgi:hypothetical protein
MVIIELLLNPEILLKRLLSNSCEQGILTLRRLEMVILLGDEIERLLTLFSCSLLVEPQNLISCSLLEVTQKLTTLRSCYVPENQYGLYSENYSPSHFGFHHSGLGLYGEQDFRFGLNDI